MDIGLIIFWITFALIALLMITNIINKIRKGDKHHSDPGHHHVGDGGDGDGE